MHHLHHHHGGSGLVMDRDREEKRRRKEEKERAKTQSQKAFPGVRLNVLPNDKDWSQDGCSIFGRPIPKRSSTLTPFLLTTIKWLEKNALTTEGLFRVTAAASEVEGLMALLERGTNMKQINLDVYRAKPHVVSTIMKRYFREIPEPLMSFELYYAYIEIRRTHIVEDLVELLNKLDTGKLVHMKFLMRFLYRVHEHSAMNKMTAENLAIVFAPSLLRAPLELEPEIVLRNCGVANTIVTTMIVYYTVIFEDKLRDRFMSDAIDPEVHVSGWTKVQPASLPQSLPQPSSPSTSSTTTTTTTNTTATTTTTTSSTASQTCSWKRWKPTDATALSSSPSTSSTTPSPESNARRPSLDDLSIKPSTSPSSISARPTVTATSSPWALASNPAHRASFSVSRNNTGAPTTSSWAVPIPPASRVRQITPMPTVTSPSSHSHGGTQSAISAALPQLSTISDRVSANPRQSLLMPDPGIHPKNTMIFCSSFVSEGDFIELPWL